MFAWYKSLPAVLETACFDSERAGLRFDCSSPLTRFGAIPSTHESHLFTSRAAVYGRTVRFGRIVVGR